VRVDVIGKVPQTIPENFSVSPLVNKNLVLEAEFFGQAPVSDAALQGQGYLGLIHTNSLAANTAIIATFEDTSEKEKGFSLPDSAVLQDGDEVFVFAQTDVGQFKKVAIEIESRQGDRVFVTGGLSATNQVVVEGAHQILSISKAEPAE
jgi:multidrug efflux pump subunit AcrA (membrane-fusion protein)